MSLDERKDRDGMVEQGGGGAVVWDYAQSPGREGFEPDGAAELEREGGEGGAR